LLFVNIGTSPDETEQSYSGGMCDFAQGKASVELCINKLSDTAAKFELKTNCAKFDSELEELGTVDVLEDSGVSSGMGLWKGAERLANWSSPLPIYKNGDRSE